VLIGGGVSAEASAIRRYAGAEITADIEELTRCGRVLIQREWRRVMQGISV